MNLKYIYVNSDKELLQYRDDILVLFEACFQQKLEADIWYWAYQNNPNGAALVSLCYDGATLVGHYAVIPVPLVCEGKEIKSLLSMTTMVHSSYRRHGVFVRQSEIVYREAERLGYSFVYGFPNKNSAPGFRKRLNWQIPIQDYIISIKGSDLITSDAFEKYILEKNRIRFDDNQLDWRMSKSAYIQERGMVFKEFGNQIDIVLFSDEYKTILDSEKEYNLLVDQSIVEQLSYQSKKEYQFGYYMIDKECQMEFKKELILSDVF